MSRTVRAAIWILFLFVPTFGFAQQRIEWRSARDIQAQDIGTLIGTVNDVDVSRGTFTVSIDDDPALSPVMVTSDRVAARFFGFGESTTGSIAGSEGMPLLRKGDRVEVRGTGAGAARVSADEVRLLGRAVVAEKRTITSNAIEGIVRSLGFDRKSFSMKTDANETFNVRGTAATPVIYGGRTYAISNLEIGDRVSVTGDRSGTAEINAHDIVVVRSVSDRTIGPESSGLPTGRTLTSIVGRVRSIDSRMMTARVDTDEKRDVKVDLAGAVDSSGQRFRMGSLHVGDRVTIGGEFASSGEFRAMSVRPTTAEDEADTTASSSREDDRWRVGEDRGTSGNSDHVYMSSVVYGSVEEPLSESGRLVLRDDQTDEQITVLVDEDFVVRTKSGNYVAANQLSSGDQLVVKGFREPGGMIIAQTIRMR